jgi:hypothetical protein
MEVIDRIRKRGLQVPNVDPNDGGIGATVLLLLESPGPRAVASSFVSRDNPDASARNMGCELERAGFQCGARCVQGFAPRLDFSQDAAQPWYDPLAHLSLHLLRYTPRVQGAGVLNIGPLELRC